MSAASASSRYDAIVVGAGLSGLYLLHRLRELGLSAVVLEQASGVGGTWFWNRYPGARCDIESMTYSYSWSHELEQEWTWTRALRRPAGDPPLPRARRRPLRPAARHPASRRASPRRRSTRRDDRWSVTTDGGDALSAALPDHGDGLPLGAARARHPRPGALRGRAAPHRRCGRTSGVDFAGKRVGVIGTGSSAVQAIPVIAEEAAQRDRVPADARTSACRPGTARSSAEADRERKARYDVYRRKARTTTARQPVERARAERVGRDARGARARVRGALRASAGSASTRPTPTCSPTPTRTSSCASSCATRSASASTTPSSAELLCPYDHPLGTKRMCVDTGYFETYNRPNVRLVSIRETPIDEITETGLRVGGEEFAFDTIVLGTGFDAMTGALLARRPARPRRPARCARSGRTGRARRSGSRSPASRTCSP